MTRGDFELPPLSMAEILGYEQPRFPVEPYRLAPNVFAYPKRVI